MKKKSRKTLIRLLDKLYSEKARQIARYSSMLCSFCPLRGNLAPNPITDCFHFLSRQHYSTRWTMWNLWGSCSSCNILYEQDADFVAKVVDWFIERNGQERWDSLVKLYHTPTPIKTWELQELYNHITLDT